MKTSRFPSHAGFTLVEILIALAVIAVISSTSYVVIQGAAETDRVRTSVLTNDVNTLNSAVQLYLANGGEIPANLTAEQVLERLKSRASEESAASSIGLTGSFIDPRIVIEPQTAAEGASNRARALWNSAARRFVVSEGGPQGIKEFRLSDAAGVAEYAEDERNTSLRAATETQWIWDYQDTPATVSLPGSNPNPVLGADPDPFPTRNTNQLAPPTYSEAPGSLALANFDLNVTIQNPNPSGASQLYFSLNGSPYVVYGGQTLTVTPETIINSFAASIDPDRWTDSDISPALYEADPVTLAVTINNPSNSLTFAQAGGAMLGMPIETPPPATVNITNLGEIPLPYQNSSNFEIVYTTDGSDPLVSGSAAVGDPFTNGYLSPFIARNLGIWGDNTSLTLRAAARALNSPTFISSQVATATVSITPTELAMPVIDPPGGLYAVEQQVTITPAPGFPVPEEFRIFYTVDGTDPGSVGGNPLAGIPYTGAFVTPDPAGSETIITARVYGPEGYTHWFTPSPAAVVAFTAPGGSSTPAGALVGAANINGTFRGSLIWARRPNNGQIQFNSGAQVLGGSVYVPGLPAIRIQPPTRTVVGEGQAWVEPTPPIPRSFIGGKEYLPDGTEVVPSSDDRQVVDLDGDTQPSNYRINMDGSAYIEGKLYRRSDPPPFPTVTVPTGLPLRGSVTANNGNNFAIQPGDYSSVTVNGGGVIQIGDPNSTEPQRYIFRSLNLNSGSRIEVVGPVIVTLTTNPSISGIWGNPSDPGLLQIEISTSGNFNMNSSAELYAALVAPDSNINLNNIFVGSVVANQLTVNGNGIFFSLPPVIDG